MAEVDLELVRKMADSAQERADRCHTQYDEHLTLALEHQDQLRNLQAASHRMEAQTRLNDYFYWIGHTNAYRGIVAMAELATVVEDELESEGTCP